MNPRSLPRLESCLVGKVKRHDNFAEASPMDAQRCVVRSDENCLLILLAFTWEMLKTVISVCTIPSSINPLCFGGESKSPWRNVTSTKIPDILYVQKLFLASEEFTSLIWLTFFRFYLANVVNQDWIHLIDSQIMVIRDRISFIFKASVVDRHPPPSSFWGELTSLDDDDIE
jgi:hypothetical protein